MKAAILAQLILLAILPTSLHTPAPVLEAANGEGCMTITKADLSANGQWGLANFTTESIQIDAAIWPTWLKAGNYTTASLINASRVDRDFYVILLHEAGWHLGDQMHGHGTKGLGAKSPTEENINGDELALYERVAVAMHPVVCVLN